MLWCFDPHISALVTFLSQWVETHMEIARVGYRRGHIESKNNSFECGMSLVGALGKKEGE